MSAAMKQPGDRRVHYRGNHCAGHHVDHRGRVRGFTLIEMLVVLGIAAIIIPIALVTAAALSNGYRDKQAMSVISSNLSMARAMAIRDGRDTAVLFLSDGTGDCLVQIASMPKDPVMQTGNPKLNWKLPQFINAEDRSPDRLPEGIMVAAPKFSTFTNTGSGGAGDIVQYVGPQLNKDQKVSGPNFDQPPTLVNPLWASSVAVVHFAVRFQADGTIRMFEDTGKLARLWYDRNGDGRADQDDPLGAKDDDKFVDDPSFQPVDVIAVFDAKEAQAMTDFTNPESLRDWIQDPAKNKGKSNLIMFNHYTGLVLRAPK